MLQLRNVMTPTVFLVVVLFYSCSCEEKFPFEGRLADEPRLREKSMVDDKTKTPTEHDRLEYFCFIKDPKNIHSKGFTWYIQYPEKKQKHIEDDPVVGGNVYQKMETQHNSEKKYSWQKVVIQKLLYAMNKAKLTCQTKAGAKKRRATLKIDMFFFPRVKIKRKSKYIKPGETLTLTCEFTGYPRPALNFWKFSGNPQPLKQKKTILTKPGVTEKDAGTYTCNVTQIRGTTKAGSDKGNITRAASTEIIVSDTEVGSSTKGTAEIVSTPVAGGRGDEKEKGGVNIIVIILGVVCVILLVADIYLVMLLVRHKEKKQPIELTGDNKIPGLTLASVKSAMASQHRLRSEILRSKTQLSTVNLADDKSEKGDKSEAGEKSLKSEKSAKSLKSEKSLKSGKSEKSTASKKKRKSKSASKTSLKSAGGASQKGDPPKTE